MQNTGQACACRRASPPARGSEALMDKLYFVGSVAILCWAVWFFFIKD